MGQRLNIEIHENGKCLANAYYHWSAFTEDSLSLTQRIVNYFPYRHAMAGLVCACELLQHVGANFAPEELIRCGLSEELARIIGSGAHRDNGLIAISEEGIEETRFWEEARVIINIDTNIVDFQVICECEPYELGQKHIEFINVPFDNHNIPFNCFATFKSYFDEAESRIYKFKNGEPPMTAIY